MTKFFQQFKQTACSALLVVTSSAVCFGQSKAPQIKVAVETVQKQTIKTQFSSTPNKSDHLININLINQTGSNQNLKSINITVTPNILIPDGTPYVKGADHMGDKEGQMMKMQTGEKPKYNNSNMYLMFKRGEEDYLLVGLISWRTFLCNIITENGLIKIIGDGDGKELKAGQRVAFDKVVYMQDKSWQDLQERYAVIIAKENGVKAPKNANWTGWSTWDFYVQKFLPGDVESNTEAIKNLNIPVNIIQLDGGWWQQRGDYFETRDNLPGGIKSIIEKIHKAGYKAGLHFDGMRVSKGSKVVKEHPDYFIHTDKGGLFEFNKDVITKDPLVYWDFSNAGARDYIKRAMKNAKENWKADYLKIDFLRHGLFKGISYLPVTNLERFRMGINAMKEGFGNDVYFLACSANFGSMIGLSEALRTGK
jgi:alpha-galactosidase